VDQYGKSLTHYTHSLLQIDLFKLSFVCLVCFKSILHYFAVHLSRNLLDIESSFNPSKLENARISPPGQFIDPPLVAVLDALLLPRYPLLVLNLGHGRWGLNYTDLPPPLPAQASSATSTVAPWPIYNYRCNNQLRCSNA